MTNCSVLWFRHGLRLHDNPALLEALKCKTRPFYPVFIFDGETAGTKLVGYNRMRFLLESLCDLDQQFRAHGGRLFIFQGSTEHIFRRLIERLGMELLCFEQDCEPIWRARDNAIKRLCNERNICWKEMVSHTLWDPQTVIKENGGSPPLTYQSFLYVCSNVGDPPRPVSNVNWSDVLFGDMPDDLAKELNLFNAIPTPENFGLFPDYPNLTRMVRWKGGETQALVSFKSRLKIEEGAFRNGYFLPNQANPDLLGPPASLSAALRFGCLSVRRFYWAIHDMFKSVHGEKLPHAPHITEQLIWREYFYTMSINNDYYAEMERNPICLNISWTEPNKENLDRWKYGKTGYPFIDAAMRQLLLEGWIHHVARNAVACFLTRGDLWYSWEHGVQHFFKYLLDADWSVCAGNWMWVSSSAFEQVLDCSHCICPVAFGRRLDPEGEYIKRYVPELNSLPTQYLYEPWKAPLNVQEKANCVIGRDYPERIVDHLRASKQNAEKMAALRRAVLGPAPPHCRPSNNNEALSFMGLENNCHDH